MLGLLNSDVMCSLLMKLIYFQDIFLKYGGDMKNVTINNKYYNDCEF